MYKELITNKLRAMNIPYTIHGIEIRCRCLNPQHTDATPSFSINSKTTQFYCFSCQYKGTFKRYLEGEIDEDLERNSKYLEALRALEDLDAEPDDYENVEHILPPRSNIEVQAFRGLSKELVDKFDLYYCNLGRYAGRIIFPIDGGFDARVMPLDSAVPRAEKAKYLRPSYFKTAKHMYICKVNESPEVIICEGVMDALSFAELGYNAAANFGLLACSPDKAGQLFANGFTTVLAGFDRDKAGFEGWAKVKDSFREYFEIAPPNKILKELDASDYDDINDYLQFLKDNDDNSNCGFETDSV